MPELYHYLWVSAYIGVTVQWSSFCWMVPRGVIGPNIKLIAGLKAPCGRIHRLVEVNGVMQIWRVCTIHELFIYLFIHVCQNKALDRAVLPLQHYVCDMSIPFDIDAAVQGAKDFVHENGPYGPVSEQLPHKQIPWVFQSWRGAPMATKDPYAFTEYIKEGGDGDDDAAVVLEVPKDDDDTVLSKRAPVRYYIIIIIYQ
jgi:hypothetical protein